MIKLVLIGYSIIVFYAGIFVGAWWMNRAHAIRTLEGDDWDGDGEPDKCQAHVEKAYDLMVYGLKPELEQKS